MIESENGGLEKKIPGGQSTFRDGPCNPRSVRGGDGNLGGGGNSLKKIFRMYYAFFAVTGQQRS